MDTVKISRPSPAVEALDSCWAYGLLIFIWWISHRRGFAQTLNLVKIQRPDFCVALEVKDLCEAEEQQTSTETLGLQVLP